jgi:hypothetical protein
MMKRTLYFGLAAAREPFALLTDSEPDIKAATINQEPNLSERCIVTPFIRISSLPDKFDLE